MRHAPQQVEDGALVGTNGKMLHILLENPRYTTLAVEEGRLLWQALLQLVERNSCVQGEGHAEPLHALIDCGALLEGITNR